MVIEYRTFRDMKGGPVLYQMAQSGELFYIYNVLSGVVITAAAHIPGELDNEFSQFEEDTSILLFEDFKVFMENLDA